MSAVVSRASVRNDTKASLAAHKAFAANPRCVLGRNLPSPFELSECEIGDLYQEATNWLDGTSIKTEAQAGEVAKLLDLSRKATKTADERRKVEAAPFDEGKAEVQARYNPLKVKTTAIEGGCKAALAKWLIVVDAEKRAIAAAAQAEADEKARLAQELFAATESTNIEARVLAEEMAEDAKEAQKWATRAANDKASVKGGARAVTLRTRPVATLTSVMDAANYYFERKLPQFEAFLVSLAQTDAESGVRNIPGFQIEEVKVAQ